MNKWIKQFWLTPKQYPNGSSFSRLEVLAYQCVALLGLVLCVWALWALQFPIGYISSWISQILN